MSSNPPTPHSPEPGGRSRGPFAELNELLEALCEDRVSPEGMRRIEELALADRAALHYYLDFIAVHGALQWDTAKSGTAAPPRDITRPAAPVAAARTISDSKPASDPNTGSGSNTGSARPRTNRRAAAAMAVALLALVAVCLLYTSPSPRDS